MLARTARQGERGGSVNPGSEAPPGRSESRPGRGGARLGRAARELGGFRRGLLRPCREQNMILAIEGVDGAGKNTLARRLKTEIVSAGWTVATISFPRYDVEPLGPVVRRMLAGDAALAELAASPKAAALLFALDRGARAA